MNGTRSEETGGGEGDKELRDLFMLSQSMLCIAGTDGYLKRVNPAFERTLGHSAEELLARPFVEFVHPEDRQATLDEVRRLAEGVPTIRFQNRYLCKDGSYRWLSWAATPADGGTRIYATATDVTDVKRAERAIRDSEARYRRLLRAVTTYTYTVRLEGGSAVSTEHGPGCLAATGYGPEDYAADPNLWIKMVPPEDRALVLHRVRRAMQGQYAPPIEHRILHKDGRTRWIRGTLVPHRDKDGVLVRYDGLVEDITERKVAEDRFRHLLESAPDGMVMVDDSANVVLVNRQAERMFGYGPGEMLGEPVDRLVPGEMRARHAQRCRAFRSDARPRTMGSGMELRGVRKDGTEFPAEIALNPQHIDGALLVTCVVRDITLRKQAERTILENQIQFLAAQRIQEHLLPEAPPKVEGFDLAGVTRPADFAAGDYHDYLAMSDGALGLVVADVSGHGIASALLAASTQAYLRSLAHHHPDIVEILRLVDDMLSRDTAPEHFVTLFFGRLDPAARTFQYANAGHPTGYVLDAGGAIKRELPSTAMPLGLHCRTGFDRAEPVGLDGGDMVVLLTDGVLEALSPDGERFGPRRALDVVRDTR
ncbi:MAG TPA: PAS domain S-box protein, partial [Phycisphaerae bacterium]|nr:PAS domain S-box protein [Phycisphaerae bacterium]